MAAITTLVVTLLIAIPFFKLPVGIASGAVVEGFFQRYHSDWLYRYDDNCYTKLLLNLQIFIF